MRFWWRPQSARPAREGRQARQTAHSRPRVARAVEAARQAGAAMSPVSLGSASVDVASMAGMESIAALRHFDAVERAAISGPLHKAQRRAKRGLGTDLIWATARAAKQEGRQPEEVWAEALRDWLASRE